MKKPSAWKLVASLGCIAVFGGLAVGTTYSLFTSQKKVNTLLTIAGSDSIKATLYLKELKQDVLNDDGMIETQDMLSTTIKKASGDVILPDSTTGYVDLTDYDYEKYPIFSTVKLVPTMTGTATFVLKNTGDVAFDYTVNVTKTALDKDGDTDDELARQIVFKSPEGQSTESVKKGGEKEITISYEFLNDQKNNDVMESTFSASLTFKLSSVSKATA